MQLREITILFMMCLVLFSCRYAGISHLSTAERLRFTILDTIPHDTLAFTQGLVFHNDSLWESTGGKRSEIGITDLKTGTRNIKSRLNAEYFGEGITVLNEKLYQLTLRNNTGFVYDLSGVPTDTFRYKGRGWGLTTDGSYLIMSDGSDDIRYLDPETFTVERILKVKLGEKRLKHLNELEFIDGYIYANVWLTDYIVKIDTSDGQVKGVADLTKLYNAAVKAYPRSDVLNGIAWQSSTGRIYITGKNWPFMVISVFD